MTRNIRHSLESMLGALPKGALAMVMACAVLASCIREELPHVRRCTWTLW